MFRSVESLKPGSSWLKKLGNDLRPQVLVPSITAGLVAGIIDIPVVVSLAVLIFPAALAGYVASGIGLALFAGLAVSLVVSLTSSYRGTVAMPQEAPAAILALLAAAVVGGMPATATSEEAFWTVVAAIAISSLLTGAFFLVLGWCRLGTLIRYIPYPVLGGFLAGTGWLLVQGAMGVMTGAAFGFAQLPSLFQADILARWLPGLLFAGLLVGVLRRNGHFLILPGMLAAAMGLFYGVLWLTGTTLAEASVQGWLLGPLPQGALWRPFTLPALAQVHWPAIVGQAGKVGMILFMSVSSLLLNTSSLELTVRQDIHLNRELQAAGWANLAAGLGGGPVGFHNLSASALGSRIGARSRLVGVTVAFMSGALILFGAPLLSYFPRPVVGGLLLFLGLTFLVEWVFDAAFKLSAAEYGIVLLILIAMSALGMLQGVGVGILLAVVLFVVSYSRIRVVKHTLSGVTYRSNVDRPRVERRTLHQRGQWLTILELQGFLFFGTANKLLAMVRARMEAPDLPAPRFIVLDFRQVLGLDASAVLSFSRIRQLANARDASLVFTHLAPRLQRQLAKEVLTNEEGARWCIHPDLDRGAEWCEEQVLQMAGAEEDRAEGEASPEPDPLEVAGLADLRGLMERQAVPEGHYLIHQGDPPRGLYLIETGQVTALRECPDGRVIRLRKMGPRTIVGEMGLYLGEEASASVVTDQPSTVYFLPIDHLRRMEETAPGVAATFYRHSAQLLSERLCFANDTLQALLVEPDLQPTNGPAGWDRCDG